MKVAGHIYYVFGGASGLGEATARRLHSQGACVAIWDLNFERAESVAKSLNAEQESQKMTPGHGPEHRALAHQVDICEETQILQAIEAADKQWKGVPVGGAVIASGVGMVGKVRSPRQHDVAQKDLIADHSDLTFYIVATTDYRARR